MPSYEVSCETRKRICSTILHLLLSEKKINIRGDNTPKLLKNKYSRKTVFQTTHRDVNILVKSIK